jgi:hypothetical protein
MAVDDWMDEFVKLSAAVRLRLIVLDRISVLYCESNYYVMAAGTNFVATKCPVRHDEFLMWPDA